MEHVAVALARTNKSIDGISRHCGEVTVGCSDVAGVVNKVLESFASLRAEHDALKGTVKALDDDQKKVTDACDEARLLSQRAIERLGEGRRHIRSSLTQITDLLDAVQTLTRHVTGFAAAMEQVKTSSQEIEQIADKTNILALNAAIEARRAGEAGRTFTVVANEVKSLAGDAHRASNEITRTIEALAGEGEQVIARIKSGAEASEQAKSSVAGIERAIEMVSDLIVEVDNQNDQISRNTGTISTHVHQVQEVIEGYDRAAGKNEERLRHAHHRIEALELTASGMFDALVKAGLSPEDSLMVERAQGYAREVAERTERAIAEGELSAEALFDREYREIAGSNPKRYRTRLTDWADRVWQPMLDRYSEADPRIMASACTDMNGFLPTHLSKHSRPPTGDVVHDTQFCRNGRKILDTIDQKAKASGEPYMMAVYRHEGDGRTYRVVRNVYVPLVVAGRRWGDVELAYSFD
ncbi:chemotaxis protein [Altererythrobacter salegens]|uniref:Chemotaxis protein n=1 Tax=Croceibacterium salegens TaxID=1737568 RepID=A0A6I4SWE9_9SPHN|nr:methyl-accepting chemotaxis protein [Croceibacterium salegens]MXO59669.1 chemotaxis protein [Croceibacterium salegens]